MPDDLNTLQELAQIRDELATLQARRLKLIRQAIREGHTTRAVGAAAGYSHARIQQLTGDPEAKPFISEETKRRLLS